jgi:hypothetical protein
MRLARPSIFLPEVQHWANPLPATRLAPAQINPLFHHAWGLGSRPNSARAPYAPQDR